MYTSSSFYSAFHPSMEEQVELARQISQSLSADTNSTSKGQSMYVKRRNRSTKWIHEGKNTRTFARPDYNCANPPFHPTRTQCAHFCWLELNKVERFYGSRKLFFLCKRDKQIRWDFRAHKVGEESRVFSKREALVATQLKGPASIAC